LLNLLNNAYDAVKSQETRWISIDWRMAGDLAEIRVTDSGPGVPTELREKIFQPFFTTKKVGFGTGLGLSISSNILRSHQGELRLETAGGHTCFVMALPLKQGTLKSAV
jgi:C4-dicarboxylate-specific signal transduction histidine kinase